MQKTILLIVNYAEDNTPYLNEKYLENILLDLEQTPATFLKQFTEKYLIENPEKYDVAVIIKNEISLKLQDLSQKVDVKNYWN